MSSTDQLIPSTTVIVLIITAVLILLVTLLVIVLLVICIRYHKRANVIQSSSNMSVTMSASEASKYYVVESATSKGTTTQDSTTSQQEITTNVLLPISHDIVNMKPNINYHQLRLNGNSGGKSPDSVKSSTTPYINLPQTPSPGGICITFDEPQCSGELPITCYSASDIKFSSNNEMITLQTSNSCSVARTHSDTQLSRMNNELTMYGPIYGDISSSKMSKVVHINPSNIEIIKSLGVGNFGSVHLAYTVGLSAKDLGLGEDDNKLERHEVAVKMLQQNASQNDCKAFRKEVKCMSKLKHKNVIQILAVCGHKEQLFILLEYMKNGDLHRFLNRYYSVNMGHETYDTTISYSKLVYICTQIASAMEYLASCKFVHRDLATRNCLVGNDFLIKVADFGLSRNLYNSCYYRFRGSAILPIRWMAPECFYGRFSEKTDVWAYGVTMWEVFSLAKERPYTNLDDQGIVQQVLHGSLGVLEQPECCSREMYNIMKRCLEHNAIDRPDFKTIHSALLSLS